jgi:hypothetical protein
MMNIKNMFFRRENGCFYVWVGWVRWLVCNLLYNKWGFGEVLFMGVCCEFFVLFF